MTTKATTNQTHQDKCVDKSKSNLLPTLLVNDADLPTTARTLRDRLAEKEVLFERGTPIKLVQNQTTGIPRVVPLTRNRVVIEAHDVCRPVVRDANGDLKPVTVPSTVADLYLSLNGEWNLRTLFGITTSPILNADGTIICREGYDSVSKLWCSRIPTLQLIENPTLADAEAALTKLRATFCTFPFADSIRRMDTSQNVEVVDLSQPPGLDESAFITSLLTAVCRSSLVRAPGFIVRAPAFSGSGTGKGMLVRAISLIAFGLTPTPFTVGESRAELDKRINAALLEAEQVIFVDNVNGQALKSDLVSQLLTEGPVIYARKLGSTKMLPLPCSAFFAVTGNNLTVSEDLVRRFFVTELDARCENPEQRDFRQNFLDEIARRRAELLSSAVTLWRWGRQNAQMLRRGRSLGSFEQWGEWCRDPLLTLGARDPVDRIAAIKSDDLDRLARQELFAVWHQEHSDHPIAVKDLAKSVCQVIDPQNRGRQYRSSYLKGLVNTQIGEFVLTKQKPAGHWGHATYAVQRRST